MKIRSVRVGSCSRFSRWSPGKHNTRDLMANSHRKGETRASTRASGGVSVRRKSFIRHLGNKFFSFFPMPCTSELNGLLEKKLYQMMWPSGWSPELSPLESCPSC